MCESTMPNLVKNAILMIQQKYPYLYGSGDLSEALGVSSSHLIREFKKSIGQSPTQYLIGYKLAQAKKLLLKEEFYIDTVANVVGFSCGNYFAKVFKKHFGISPRDYIAQNRGKVALQEGEGEFPEWYL